MEPFGAEHTNHLWGILCATVANFSQVIVKENGGPKRWEPADFVPYYGKEPEQKNKKQTAEEMKQALLGIAKSVNAANKRNRR